MIGRGFFLTLDVMGFGNIIRNSNAEDRARRIERWLKLVDESARVAGLDAGRIQLISDTVFAAADDTVDGLRGLVAFSRHMLNDGVRLCLPVRGGIAHGDYEWGRLTFGPAVVAAHELEAAQNWIGVSCYEGLPHTPELWGFGSLVAYVPPMKAGHIMIRPVVDWEVPTTKELAGLLGREGLMKEGDVVNWSMGEKLNNTIQFKLYKQIVKKHMGDASKFWGLTAMEVLEAALQP